jgi:hypothetical protein
MLKTKDEQKEARRKYLYRYNNSPQRKKYMKQYYKDHGAEYYQKNKKREQERVKMYQNSPEGKVVIEKYNKSPQRKEARKKYDHSPKGKECKRRLWKEGHIRCLSSWVGIIPKLTNCEACGRVITFNSGSLKTSIFFDHRHEGREAIKNGPVQWLRKHMATPENVLIWKSCDFGMLCNQCNLVLPTIGRIEFITKLLKYVTKK